MPYPKTTDPDYCAGSNTIPARYDPDLHWQRCRCGRPIRARRDGRLFPHLNNVARARRRDDVQESLIAHGMNRNEQWARTTDPIYSEPESP